MLACVNPQWGARPLPQRTCPCAAPDALTPAPIDALMLLMAPHDRYAVPGIGKAVLPGEPLDCQQGDAPSMCSIPGDGRWDARLVLYGMRANWPLAAYISGGWPDAWVGGWVGGCTRGA